jgi:hypothetical protein
MYDYYDLENRIRVSFGDLRFYVVSRQFSRARLRLTTRNEDFNHRLAFLYTQGSDLRCPALLWQLLGRADRAALRLSPLPHQ